MCVHVRERERERERECMCVCVCVCAYVCVWSVCTELQSCSDSVLSTYVDVVLCALRSVSCYHNNCSSSSLSPPPPLSLSLSLQALVCIHSLCLTTKQMAGALIESDLHLLLFSMMYDWNEERETEREEREGEKSTTPDDNEVESERDCKCSNY